MSDLITDLQDIIRKLDAGIGKLAKNGQAMAQAEMNYRIALREEILKQRDKGTPVTIISDICRGDPAIAKCKFDRDVAEVVYQANLEAINTWKLQIRVMENQIGREWGHDGGTTA